MPATKCLLPNKNLHPEQVIYLQCLDFFSSPLFSSETQIAASFQNDNSLYLFLHEKTVGTNKRLVWRVWLINA